MAKEVIFTPLAISDYEKIVEYLIKRWGVFVTNDFIDRLTDVCSLIAENPERFPFENKFKQVQRCVVTEHNTLYFCISRKQKMKLGLLPFLILARIQENCHQLFNPDAINCLPFSVKLRLEICSN